MRRQVPPYFCWPTLFWWSLGFLDWKNTLMTFVHQNSQVHLCMSALNKFSSHSLCRSGNVTTNSHQSQDRLLEDFHQLPPGYRSIGHNPLAVTTQLIINPQKSPPQQFLYDYFLGHINYLQFVLLVFLAVGSMRVFCTSYITYKSSD